MATAENCSCPNSGFVEAMISHIAQTDSYYGELQRDTEVLSQEQRRSFLHSVLHKSPQMFIAQYGDKLTDVHTAYFTQHMADDADLIYQLNILKKEQAHKAQRVKNRRFTAMKDMLANGDYFSEEQMKHRDPLLYEQMVGKYLTDEEIRDQSNDLLRQHTGMSTMLLEQMDSKDNRSVYERQLSQQECQYEEEEESEEEAEDVPRNAVDSLPADERVALRQEFLHTMQERFLSGGDAEFDYESVDSNDKYDDIKQEDYDAEERYFDDMEDGEGRSSPSALAPLGPGEYDY